MPFLLRFTDGRFTADNSISKITNFYHLYFINIGFDFKIKIFNFENKLIKLQIWNGAVIKELRAINKNYYKGVHGIILMYDITDISSFKNLENWIKQIKENVESNVRIVLVGNNCDKPDRKVAESDGKKMADDFNFGFFEASPKLNHNVNEVFKYLVGEILKVHEGNIQKNIKIKDKNNSRKNKKCH